jgi:hypothetical protein
VEHAESLEQVVGIIIIVSPQPANPIVKPAASAAASQKLVFVFIIVSISRTSW